MDFLDAAQKLATDNPDVTYNECRAAMQSETDSEMNDQTRHGKRRSTAVYRGAVESAYNRIVSWLQTGHEYSVLCTWRDVAKFAASHRQACVWAVCVSNARQQEKEAALAEMAAEVDAEQSNEAAL